MRDYLCYRFRADDADDAVDADAVSSVFERLALSPTQVAAAQSRQSTPAAQPRQSTPATRPLPPPVPEKTNSVSGKSFALFDLKFPDEGRTSLEERELLSTFLKNRYTQLQVPARRAVARGDDSTYNLQQSSSTCALFATLNLLYNYKPLWNMCTDELQNLVSFFLPGKRPKYPLLESYGHFLDYYSNIVERFDGETHISDPTLTTRRMSSFRASGVGFQLHLLHTDTIDDAFGLPLCLSFMKMFLTSELTYTVTGFDPTKQAAVMSLLSIPSGKPLSGITAHTEGCEESTSGKDLHRLSSTYNAMFVHLQWEDSGEPKDHFVTVVHSVLYDAEFKDTTPVRDWSKSRSNINKQIIAFIGIQ